MAKIRRVLAALMICTVAFTIGGFYDGNGDTAAAYGIKKAETGSIEQTAEAELTDIADGQDAYIDGQDADTDGSDPMPSSQLEERTISAKVGSNTVEVTAPMADDVTVEATEIREKSKGYNKYVKQAAQAMNMNASDFTFARVLDINPFDSATGEEFQPDGSAKVSVKLADEKIGKNEEVAVLHFTDAAASDDAKAGAASGTANATDPSATTPEVVESEVKGRTVEFETDGFSVFVLVGYTVDFHWGEYTYNLAGGGNILVSELLGILAENTADDPAVGYDSAKLEEISGDMNRVESVSFSNPDLVEVQKLEILDSQKLIEDDYSEELVEITHNDWLLTSLQPFDTEELLTITLTNGEVIEIPVTDIRYGDDAGETVTRTTGRYVKADGVTYLLSNAGTGNGTARVTGMAGPAVVHDVIVYNNHSYTVENIREAVGILTGNKNTMDWDVVSKIATYGFQLPAIVDQLADEDDPTQGTDGELYVSGENNTSGDTKVWKKAEYNAETNSVEYTLKYFQPMKKDVPLDFIFVYDDSASMYSGNRDSGGITLSEAQTTRVLIQSAAKALFSKGAADGYDINVYLAGASTGDRSTSAALTSYEAVEEYLSTYRTGTTEHSTGVSNALTLARASKNANPSRNPVVIYLSDFHQPGSLGTAGANSASALHSIAQVYGLGTDTAYRYTTNLATRNIPNDANHYRTMNDIGGGIRELENIIKEAIGYYIKGSLTVTDDLSSPMAGLTATNTTGSGNGTVTPAAGKVTWNLGDRDPLLGAGQVYTETFTVDLDNLDGSKVYSGSMPTNGSVSVKQGNAEVNKIDADLSPKVQNGIGFVLGKMNKDGTYSNVKLDGVNFTLQKDGETTTEEYTTDTNGAFSVPFADYAFVPGEKYTLTQDQTTTDALTGDKDVTIANPMTWTLTVNSDYTITVAKAGADTDATISGGKINLWNREFTNPPLTKIYVQKVWDASVDDSQKQPITFTVYGKNGNDRIELPAYAADDDGSEAARAANARVTQLKATDVVEGVPYKRAVWVPEYAVSNSGNIRFKDGDDYNYTIGEDQLKDLEDVADTPVEIIGAPGEWGEAVPGIGTVSETTSYTTGGWAEAGNPSNYHIVFTFNVREAISNVTYVDIIFTSPNNGNKYKYSFPTTSSNVFSTTGNKAITVKRMGTSLGASFSNIEAVYINGDETNNVKSKFTNISFAYSQPASNSDPTGFRYRWGTITVEDEILFPLFTLTNSIEQYKVLTINSLFKDSSLNASATGRIEAVGYEIVDEDGKVIAAPEVQVAEANQLPLDPNERKRVGGDVKVYVPKDKEYTVKQTYYKLAGTGVMGAVGGGTTVDADSSGKFSAFETAPDFSTGSDSSKCTVSGASASMQGQAASDGTVTFTNDRVKLPVDVKATWDPDLDEVNAPDDNARVEAEGIPYEFSWGEGSSDKLTDQTVKKADTEVDSAPWTKRYDTAVPATAVPSYTIEGEKTRCVITSETEPHPYYDTEVVRQETGSRLIFTIVNTVKKGEITIAKDWDIEQFEESGATETAPPVMGPTRPESVTVQVKKVDSEQNEEIMYFNGEHHQVSSSAEGASQDLLLNQANGWKVTVTGLDVGQKYVVVETKIGDENAEETAFAQEYVVEQGTESGTPDDEEAVIDPLTLDETIVNINNSIHPIARVSDDDGMTWSYYEYLITTNSKPGAFDYANTLTGDVIIETLKEGNNGSTDDTKFTGDTVGRYTLGSMATFNNNADITLRTAPGLGFTSIIHRGFNDGDGLIKFSNSGKTFTTSDIIFDGSQKNTTKYSGRLMYIDNGSLEIKGGTTVRNFSTSGDGGAIFTSGKPVTLTANADETILFDNCVASGEGGAIRPADGSVIINSEGTVRFEDCSASSAGGAISTNSGSSSYSVTITNSGTLAFDNCTCSGGTYGGGAIWTGAFTATNTGAGTIDFNKCVASNGYAGAIATGYKLTGSNGNSTITNNSTGDITFSECSAKNDGGGIYANGNVSITGSGETLFTKCSAVDGGGIYQAGGSSITLTNVTFGAEGDAAAGCTATSEGGAIYTSKAGTMTDCSFYYCKATGTSGGGAILFNGGNQALNGCVFDHCQVSGTGSGNGNGGAIRIITNSEIVIDRSDSRRSSFSDCTANRYGGAIEYELDNTGKLEVNNTDFTNCISSTTYGGAIASDAAKLTVSGCTFTGCKAENGNGGAVAVGLDHGNGTAALENTSISGCKAKAGAAVYLNGNGAIKQSGTGTSEIKSCSATNATGGAVNVTSGKKIDFEGSVVVYDNVSGGQQRNVVLDQSVTTKINTTSTGLGANAHIGVYVTGNNAAPYTTHGQYEQDFGSYPSGGSTANFNTFTNDRNGLYGEISSNTGKIRWQSYLCKLTDASGNLLYKDAAHTQPAVYNYLMTQTDTNKVGGFSAAQGTLYTSAGDAVANDAAVQVQMLKNYTQPSTDAVTNPDGRAVTLKTAGTTATASDVFVYNPGNTTGWSANDERRTKATITRGYNGGSMFSSSGTFTTTGIILDGGSKASTPLSCSGNGGIINASAGTVNVNANTVMRNSTATGSGSGGAVYSAGTLLNITDAEFNNCQGKGGGAVHHDQTADNSKTTIVGTEFTKCNSSGTSNKQGGGALLCKAHELSITGSDFTECKTENENTQGGAVFHYPDKNSTDSETTVSGCEFSDCYAGKAGGALETSAGITEVRNSNFSKCIANAAEGGAILIWPFDIEYDKNSSAALPEGFSSSVTISGCSFDQCESRSTGKGSGGGVGSYAEQTTVTDSNFTDCKADKNGGAIGAHYKYTTARTSITSCEFINCSCSGNGGAVDTNSYEVTIEGTMNAAGTAVSKPTRFINCSSSGGNGGAVNHGDKKNKLTIKDGCEFVNCSAGKVGGAVNIGETMTTTIARTDFYNCYATGDGGSIYLKWVNDSQTLGISNSNFDGHASYTYTDSKGNATDYTLPDSTKNGKNGGAINTQGGTTTLTNVSIKDCTALEKGGGVYDTSAKTLNLNASSIIGHDSLSSDVPNAASGGAVYLAAGGGGKKSTYMVMGTGSAIKQNTAANGAGVYVANLCQIKLSGNPDFGGTDVYAEGETIPAGKAAGDIKGSNGNFATGTMAAGSLNGNKSYSRARQDIYIEENNGTTPSAILVTGDLTGAAGTIWVWEVNSAHYLQQMPFAKFESNVSFADKVNGAVPSGKYDSEHLKVFRNARPDGTTENGTDTYLYGTIEGEKAGFAYWTGIEGSRRVILRKVDSTYAPLSGKEFTIYKGSSTTAYKPKGETDSLSGLTSGSSGCFWVGNLPYGWYIVKETNPSRYFFIVVTASGTYGTLETNGGVNKDKVGGYGTLADAQAAAIAKYDELK